MIDGVTVTPVELAVSDETLLATDIAVDTEGHVYVSGYIWETAPDSASVAYWVDNGSGKVELSTELSSESNGISLYGGDIYIAGRDFTGGASRASYWENNGSSRTDLTTVGARAASVWTGNGSVYVAGTYYNSVEGRFQAAYWVNSASGETNLDGDGSSSRSDAYGIAVSGSAVYVSGTQTVGGTAEAVYWKNGSLNVIVSGVESRANMIFISP